MAVKREDGLYYCEVCGKYYHEKEGYVRSHERAKHGIGHVDKVEGVNKKGLKESKEAEKLTCLVCAGSKIRLLNSVNPAERRAIQAGYRRLCEQCGEVF